MTIDSARAKSLFLKASDMAEPAIRATFLDQECGTDAELRARVEALLKANDQSPLVNQVSDNTTLGGTTSGPIDPELILPAEFRTQPEAGTVVSNRYILEQKIGEGGMGEVWVARQTEPVKRSVALKLIKPGMDSRSVLSRFEQEHQALALMDHPIIAKVLDAGLTPTGQPFFVMELVNGLPLNKFCDELKLTPRERLELFVPICQAVHHAHQKGIVHRDLKPANILITMIDGKPVPKVIDFGVAKATAGKLTDKTLATQFGSVVGTLEYMSPEQAGFSGEDIDTRSDIYSLGVILYEMLTGLKPFDSAKLKKVALTEMIRIIREEDPSRPSTRLSTNESLPSLAALRRTGPKKLMSMLRGELDWVVMKCLEKQRERRYETANGLAREIQRYLANEMVEARPPSLRYRMGKFLAKHKLALALTGCLFLMALGLIGFKFLQIKQVEYHKEVKVKSSVGKIFNLIKGDIKEYRDELSVNPDAKDLVIKTLRNWMTDPEFKYIRDETELAKLPEDTQKECRTLWGEFSQLLEMAEAINLAEANKISFGLAKITPYLKGEFIPQTNRQRLALIEECRKQSLHKTAADLFIAAFAADPNLETYGLAPHRYNAACHSVLAATGMENDSAKLDEPERSRLRLQAYSWLNAELVAYQDMLARRIPSIVNERLSHWQTDPDLASIRDNSRLSKLPPEESKAFTQLWAEVASTLEKAKNLTK